jgi:hypothetical protein
MPIATSQSPPRTGTLARVLELLPFSRDPGFAGRRFAEMGDVFETLLADQPSRLSFAGEA